MKLLKNLIENVVIFGKFVKSSYLFNSEYKKLLEKTDVSNDAIEQFLHKFNIKIQNKNSLMYKRIVEDSRKGFYIRLLRVRSFYNNHNVFKYLYAKTNLKKILMDMRTIINNHTFNQRVNIVNIEELTKNLQLLNDPEINLLVLETALRLSNPDMYKIVEKLLDFEKDKDRILQTMCSVISNYGHKIKDQPLSQTIKQYINKDNFYKYNHKSYLYNNSEHYSFIFYPENLLDKTIINISSFLGVDVTDIIAGEHLSYEYLKNLHLIEKHIKNVLKRVDRQKKYMGLVSVYLTDYRYKSPIYKRIKFLIKNNLMNQEVLEGMQEDSFIRNKIFDNYKELKNILPEEELRKIIIKHKENLANFSLNLHSYTDFFKNYPYELSELELKSFLVNSDCFYRYRNEMEHLSLEIINNKYLGQLNAPMYYLTNDKEKFEKVIEEEQTLLNVLYEKYPQYMESEAFFLEVVTQSKNDLFLYSYLNKYFENNNNEVLKFKLVHKLQTFHNICLFRNTLKWIIENNLLKELLSEQLHNNEMFVEKSNNYLVPILIEKYKVNSDIFIEKSVKEYIINTDLFYFILNNYEVSTKTQQYLCEKIYQHNSIELAEELFKRNIYPTNSFMDIIEKKPNEAGNVFIKCYLKNKLEDKYLTKSIKEKVHKI